MILKAEQVQAAIEGVHHAGRIGNPIPTAGAQVAESHEQLRAWHEATVPLIAALAVYGERASLPALVVKARELNEAPRAKGSQTRHVSREEEMTDGY